MTNSGATLREPKYHAELVDGSGNKVGLMLTDGRGMNQELAIRRAPYPRTSTRIAQGATKYSDYELPYRPIEQDNWASGRGSADFETDVARYNDAGGTNTEHENQVILGGQVTYGTGGSAFMRRQNVSLPGSVNWQGLYDAQRFIAATFVVAVGNYSADYAEIWVRKVGAPQGNMTVDIYTDVAGAPGASIVSATYNVVGITDILSLFKKYDWSGAGALVNGTTYHVVVGGAAGWTLTDCVEVGCSATAAGHKSADGSTFAASTFSPFYRVADTTAHIPGRLFEYKRQLCFLTMPDDGSASAIHYNGARGTADDNTGQLTKLIDATQTTWVAGLYDGCQVLIIAGPGSEESQPWRTITATVSGEVTVSPAWKTVHTTATEYVILGSSYWATKSTLSYCATDVAVAGEVFFVAFGAAANIEMFRQFTRAGAWVSSNTTMNYGVERLLTIQHPVFGHVLWGSDNANAQFDHCISRAVVPYPPPKVLSTADLYTKIATLLDSQHVWDEQIVSNITVSKIDNAIRIAASASFGTGVMASRALDAPVDITGVSAIGALIRSSVNVDAGQLKFVLDDTARLGKSLALLQACVLDKGDVPDVFTWTKIHLDPTEVDFYDTSATTMKILDNLVDGDTATTSLMPLETTDKWYVSYDMRFDTVSVTITEANAVASTLTAEYWNGHAWTSVAITDGTISVATKTLSGSGDITLTTPHDWQRGRSSTETTLDSGIFWLRFSVSANLTATTAIADLKVRGNKTVPTEARHYIDLNEVDDDDASESRFTLQVGGRWYAGHANKFNTVEIDLSSVVNNEAASLTALYFDGQAWVALAITDGTASGGATLAVDGSITFTQPADWEPGTGNNPESSLLDQTKYYIYLVTDADLDEVGIVRAQVKGPDVERYVDLERAYDGDSATGADLVLNSDDYLVAVAAEKYNIIHVDMGSAVNDVAATLAAQYWDGQGWTSVTITDGTVTSGKTLTKDGDISFTIPDDWTQTTVNGVTGYAIRLKPSANLKTSGASPYLALNELYATMDDDVLVDIPALVANEWSFVQCAISPNSNPNPDESQIVSVGLYLSADLGAQNVDIAEVMAIDIYPRYVTIPEKIMALEAYGDTQSNPWVFTESVPYEIQSDNNDLPIPVPLRELTGIRSETTGRAHTVNDVYLYFNLDQHLQRYYNRSLEDVGPNRDEGLPSGRQGTPITLLTYPGRVFALIDAGDSGYSSVLVRKGSGWHEVYRAPYGERLFHACLQVVPSGVSRLWLNQGADLVWVPIPKTSFNPLRDSNYRYIHEGYLVTGWISAGFLDIEKLFKSVKLFTENLGANQYIQVQYQEETGSLDSGWTNIVSVHNSSPFQEVNIASANNIAARRIRFRLIFYTNSNTTTPVLKAQVVETLLRFPVKFQYSLTCRFTDYDTDMADTSRKTAAGRAEVDMAQIDTWANAPTVLTFTNLYSPFDVKTVLVEPPGCKPYKVDPANQIEGHIVEITILEI